LTSPWVFYTFLEKPLALKPTTKKAVLLPYAVQPQIWRLFRAASLAGLRSFLLSIWACLCLSKS
jgi:hypothetical protein